MKFLANPARKDRFFKILGRQECFLDKKKEVLEMSKKLKFSKGVSPRFLSKNRTFYYLCFFGQINPEKSFFYILDKKESFLKVQATEIFQRG